MSKTPAALIAMQELLERHKNEYMEAQSDLLQALLDDFDEPITNKEE